MRKKITFRIRRAVFNPYNKNIAGEPVRMAELLLSKNGFSIAPDSQGNLGIFRADGSELGYFSADRFVFVGQNGIGNLEINLNNQTSPLYSTDPYIRFFHDLIINTPSGNTIFLNGDTHSNISFTGKITQVNAIATSGQGISGILGVDSRTGVTAVDASPITLYPQASLGQPAIASGQLYRLMGRILATAGTGPSATYTLKWTEGGALIVKALTISALDSDSDFSALIQPDPNTSITVQLTAISGTGTTVNVAALVERLA